LIDDTFCIGEIIGYEADALNSAICAFYTQRVTDPEVKDFSLERDCLISVQFVTRDLLDIGIWKVFTKTTKAFKVKKYFDLKEMRKNGFIGMVIKGSGIMRELLNAYHALLPWDKYYDPLYLDSLLISRKMKPSSIVKKVVDEKDMQNLLKIAKESRISKDAFIIIEESIENSEWERATQVLCDALCTDEIPISEMDFRVISYLGEKLKVDSGYWKKIKRK